MRNELLKHPHTDKIYLGQSICTVYKRRGNGTCGIWNFGYCEATGEFYFNKNVHLPRELFVSLDGCSDTEENIRNLEELGICNGDDFSFLIKYYENAKKEEEKRLQQIKEQQKVLNYHAILKKAQEEN